MSPAAVIDGFGSLKGFWAMVRGTFCNLQGRARAQTAERAGAAWRRDAGANRTNSAQPRGDQRMTAEVAKYTIEQIESLELAPGT